MRIATVVVGVLSWVWLGSACGDDEPRVDAADTAEVSDLAQDSQADTSQPDGVDAEDGVDAADDVGQDATSDTVDGSDSDAVDTGAGDTDVGEPDADTSDTESDLAGDSGDDTTDTTPSLPLPGFGTISGECGVLDTELADPAPSFFVNAIDFGTDPYDQADFGLLLPDSQEMIRDGNAGGSSVMSEVFALEVLERCELATLIATETEIVYDQQGKITDILVEIDGDKVGVSVTRAVGFPFDAPYTVAQAKSILEKKLGDILISSANVSEMHRWVKQILHVLAYDAPHVESLRTAWGQIAEATRADTIIIVTVTNGADAFIY